MGREVKRVSLDFDWPLHEVWRGYLNPYYDQAEKCSHCDGSGNSPEYKMLQDRWYGYVDFHPEDRGSVPFKPDHEAIVQLANRNCKNFPGDPRIEAERLCELFNSRWNCHVNEDDIAALVREGRLMDFTHTWTKENGWQPKNPPYTPTPKEVNEWNILTMGHDSINCWVVVSAECERLGYETTCEHCKGEGEFWPSEEAKKQYEEWEEEEPPKGEGWQMWETTSEGSPISPVFETPEELSQWLTDAKASSFGSETSTYDEWLAMIKGSGWAVSCISSPETGLVSGVKYESLMSEKDE